MIALLFFEFQLFLFSFFFVVCSLHNAATSSTTAPAMAGMLRLYHVDFESRGDWSSSRSFAERMERAIERSERRKQRLLAQQAEWQAVSVSAADGAFVAVLAMGTPAREFRAIVDTGSDLVWQRCRKGGYDEGWAVFDPATSSTFRNATCGAAACRALGDSARSCRSGGGGGEAEACVYSYEYGGRVAAFGWMAYDTLTVGGEQVADFAWGCSASVSGGGGGDAWGVAGLGQGSLSLVSQISAPRFSYCLAPSVAAAPSPLFLGVAAAEDISASAAAQVTPIITNAISPSFYYVNLTGISINGTLLNIPQHTFSIHPTDGSGGTIIDSGTTISYLEERAYEIVQRAIQTYLFQFKKLPYQSTFGLHLCYRFIQDEYLPNLTFHFQAADLDVPSSNLFLHLGDFTCLAMGSSNGLSILGNLQQQNNHFLFNLATRRISFMQTICDQIDSKINH